MTTLPASVSAGYVAARPFDPRAEILAASSDADAGLQRLEGARERLMEWLRENPAHLPAAREDLAALEGAAQEARPRARERQAEAEKEDAREISEMLRGIPAEDAFAAHAALKGALEAALAAEAAPPREAVDVPSPIPGLRATLRPYQREGVRFLLARGLNAIVADDMGLGKTVTAIAAVVAAEERALVVAPANTLYNWRDEVERFTGERPAVYHEGEVQGDAGARFLATTFDSLKTLDARSDAVAGRGVLIVDEAHYVRNPRTQRARLVARLPMRRRILLTGTPLVNGLEDYHALLRQVDPKRWGTLATFKETWMPEPGLYQKYAQVREATAALLQRAASDALLRRKKDDVLPELPPRIVEVRAADLSPAALRRYRAREEKARARFREDPEAEGEVLAALHAMRQGLAEARVPVVLERVRELLAEGESVVVFSEYLDPLYELEERLGDGVAALIEGATPAEERQETARELGKSGGPRVVLAQMQAGSVGINLTGARHVLFLHFAWTPSVHAQAMDRVHRMGQDRPVVVEFLVTPGTIDDRLAEVVLRKEEDQNLVLADDADVTNKVELSRVLGDAP